MNERNMIEELNKIHKEVLFKHLYSRKKPFFKQYYEVFGLPFKLYDSKGREKVMLELNEKEEQEIVNEFEMMFNKIYDAWYDSLMYGDV